jgi:hypothetical protein
VNVLVGRDGVVKHGKEVEENYPYYIFLGFENFP